MSDIINNINVNEDGCWVYQGTILPSGYGQTSVNNKSKSTHRFVYEYFNGEIYKGNVIMHSCDNRACCNPSHLSQGSQKENIWDASDKGRMATGERNGNSKLNEELVMYILADDRPSRAVAKALKVDQKTVLMIRRRETWRHING
jgi:hypothetical protein